MLSFSKDTIFGSVSVAHDVKAGTGDAMRDDATGKRKKRAIPIKSAHNGEPRQKKKKQQPDSDSSIPSESGSNPTKSEFRSAFTSSRGFGIASMGTRNSRVGLNNRMKRQAEENMTMTPPQNNIEKMKKTFMQFFDAMVEIMSKAANAFKSGKSGNGSGQNQNGYEFPQQK